MVSSFPNILNKSWMDINKALHKEHKLYSRYFNKSINKLWVRILNVYVLQRCELLTVIQSVKICSQRVFPPRSDSWIIIQHFFPTTVCQLRNRFSLESQHEEPRVNDSPSAYCFVWRMAFTYAAFLNLRTNQMKNGFLSHYYKRELSMRDFLRQFFFGLCKKAEPFAVGRGFVDPDDDIDDHCLLCIIMCESVMLSLWCSFFTAHALLSFISTANTHKYTQTRPESSLSRKEKS